jgi:hypothetical protein
MNGIGGFLRDFNTIGPKRHSLERAMQGGHRDRKYGRHIIRLDPEIGWRYEPVIRRTGSLQSIEESIELRSLRRHG